MSSTWKGTSATVANPSRKKYTRAAGNVRNIEIELDGNYTTLLDLESTLVYGTELLPYGGLYVSETTISREGRGDLATLKVTASNSIQPTNLGGSTEAPTKEITYTRVDVDIRNHPIFQTDGTYALTEEDKRNVETRFGNPSVATPVLSAHAQQLYDRLVRGQTSYMIFLPVVRKTRTSSNEPVLDNIGQIDTGAAVANGGPSQTANGKSYVYVKMEDSKSRQNYKWTRSEMWMGFIDADTAIINET